MRITPLPVNTDRLQAQIDDVQRFTQELHREQRSLRGRLLAVMEARVAVLAHLEAVHPSVSGLWQERLTAAAARPEPTTILG